jgi:hypothetical protein
LTGRRAVGEVESVHAWLRLLVGVLIRLRLQWTACPPDFRNGSFHRSLRACTGVCSPRATT